jgi:hypothetical protein
MKSHRFLAFLVVLLILPLAAFAFDVTIGVKGGVAAPFYTGADYEDLLAGGAQTEFRLGFSAGGFVTIGIIDLLAIQPEVMYSMMGGNFGDDLATWLDKVTFLEVPVLLKVRLKAGNLSLHPSIGPDFLIKIGEWKAELRDDTTGEVLPIATYDMSIMRMPIIGAVAGLGLLFPVGDGVLTVDARYHLGLMSRYTEDNGLDWKQNNVQLLVGYGFPVVK